MRTTDLRYRPEIDGLRALAVIPVILFHAGIDMFSGGFVGVDVFFVISGYLITSIIILDLQKGRFSLITFYERRVRRIFPALFFMMIVCIPLAWMHLMPSDMQQFSQSIVSVVTFSSNILFWYESGYFDSAAELKPMLHTWSLAVEEQYYILFPLFLIFAWRLGRCWILVLLVLICITSLIATQWGSYHKPNATFYLLPTRGWEILLGGLAAFYLNHGTKQWPQMINQLMSLIGLFLIAYSITTFDAYTPFPSLYALMPTVGVLFIIIFATQGTAANKLLSSTGLVGIGLVSYSAYLWHQPLFAFARHRIVDPSLTVMLGLSIISLLLAYVSWRYVERPFRSKTKIGRSTLFWSAGAIGGLLIIVGVAGYLTDGFEQQWLNRHSDEVRKSYMLLKYERDRDLALAATNISQDNGDCRYNLQRLSVNRYSRLDECFLKYGEGILILGDSHATDLFGAVSATNETQPFIIGLTKGGCRPHTPTSYCQYEEALSYLKNKPSMFSKVIYEQAGFYLLQTEKELGTRDLFTRVTLDGAIEKAFPNTEYLTAVNNYLDELARYVPVIWFGSRVEPHISERDVFRLGCEHDYQLRDNQYETFLALDEAISSMVAEANNIVFLSQNKLFDYQFPRDYMTCEEVYWTGGDHLSEVGERYFGERYDIANHPMP